MFGRNKHTEKKLNSAVLIVERPHCFSTPAEQDQNQISTDTNKNTQTFFVSIVLSVHRLSLFIFEHFCSSVYFFHGNRIFLFPSFFFTRFAMYCKRGWSSFTALSQRMCVQFGSYFKARSMHQHIPFDCKADEIVLFLFLVKKIEAQRRSHNKKISELMRWWGKRKNSIDATDRRKKEKQQHDKKRREKWAICETVKNEYWLNCQSPALPLPFCLPVTTLDLNESKNLMLSVHACRVCTYHMCYTNRVSWCNNEKSPFLFCFPILILLPFRKTAQHSPVMFIHVNTDKIWKTKKKTKQRKTEKKRKENQCSYLLFT